MKPVSTRIPATDEATLQQLEEAWDATRSEVLRRLIHQGLEDWRYHHALEQLHEHEITIRQAANQANCTYPEMLALTADEGTEIGYTERDLVQDLDRL